MQTYAAPIQKSPSQDPEEEPFRAPLSDSLALFTANTQAISQSISISKVVKPAPFIISAAFFFIKIILQKGGGGNKPMQFSKIHTTVLPYCSCKLEMTYIILVYTNTLTQ